ncbi:GPI ethanolamine phosphate transferase 2 isoform X2 [Eurosta solidaginis]|uniref:GPI ethanolamine phosphate transferase 2 isoform X2 n=1 Tax=Eurosta solidaginis TaxID=178769 RepID=UPI0035307D9B
MERKNYSIIFLLWMIASFIYGAGIFLIGFFPINNYSLVNDLEGRPQSLDGVKLVAPTKLYKQTVLVVVDALRSDFATPATMPFSYNNACSHLQLRVNIPTVTLPRIKSLTTGTISNFIDIVLNIGHVEQLSDSLLHRLHERNETAVFAGDRTWKNLFPKQFKRFTANTDSFFVNDFYEGDKNVTEILCKELEQTDWMLLVLHYLGLDHIGHVEGTESPKIPLKLKEMDDVVQKIYKAKHFHDQLVLVTGDHGMKDGGGHGGSTTAEMYVPILAYNGICISKSYRSKTYNQIDLAPTLAILWSIEIPSMSIGCLIPELLREYSLEDQLYAYYYNSLHLIKKATRKFGSEYVDSSALAKWFEAGKSAHKQFLLAKLNDKFDNAFFFENARVHYLRLSKEISDQLAATLGQFDYELIAIGLTLTTLVVLHTVVLFYVKNQRSFIYGKVLCLSVILITFSAYKWGNYQGYITITGIGATVSVLLALAMNVYFIINIANILWTQFYNFTGQQLQQLSLPSQIWWLTGCLTFHTLSLASSSFIEMESKTWHYLGSSALILLAVQNFYADLCRTYKTAFTYGDFNYVVFYKDLIRSFLKSYSTWLLVGGLLFLERLNVFAFSINKENEKILLSFFFVAGLIIYPICLRQQTIIQSHKEFVFCAITAILVYCYRSSKGAVLFVFDISCCVNIFLTMFWIVLGMYILISLTFVIINKQSRISQQSSRTSVERGFKVLLNFLLTISILLHKPHNVLLVTYLVCILSMCYKICDKLERQASHNHKHLQKLLYTIFIGNMFYFYQGNSNSFATIDLNPGYIGQSTYKPLIVGIFVTLNMYSAQFISFVFLIVHILNYNNDLSNKKELNSNEQIQFILYFYTLSIFVPVLIYFSLLLFFRYHLFIYSVFAPKALYEYYRVIVLFLTLLLTTINFFIFEL